MKDLHLLPKIRDGWSFLYAEKCRIDQEDKAIALHTIRGKTPVPCAMLATLMLGPGTTITHAAVKALAEHGCLIVWCGEDGVRFYAEGLGETRSSANLLHQVRVWSDPVRHREVVRLMYERRFEESLEPGLTIRQVRGKEGLRVRAAYAEASRTSGVVWKGRSYHKGNWQRADAANRALSAANACLYGVCHAAIVSAGFSPALGFIHTGKMLSFVYDIADLYKTDITIPVAFQAAAAGSAGVEKRVRGLCRKRFTEHQLLARLVADIQFLLGLPTRATDGSEELDDASVGVASVWNGEGAPTSGAVNFGTGRKNDQKTTPAKPRGKKQTKAKGKRRLDEGP